MKINVVVNGILSRIGDSTARNILRTPDMYLLPVSITPCGDYRKGSIDQVSIELIDPSAVSVSLVTSTSLLNYGRPDVVVDFNPNSFFKQAIPEYLDAKTSFVLVSDKEEKSYAKIIKNLGVNIILLPENSSEQQVLAAIRYLHEKNEANIFGQVFSSDDIAA